MLFILRGISGSGKSTMAERLFKREQILSSDALRREMFGTDQIDPRSSAIVWKELDRRLDYRCKNHMITVVDATNLSSKTIRSHIKTARKWGCEYVVVSIEPDIEFCRFTLQRRREGFVEGVILPDDVLETMHEKYVNSTQGILDYITTNGGDRPFIEEPLKDCYFSIKEILDDLYHFPVLDNTWVIGDIHGMLNELNDLMNNIPSDAVIVSAGDILDRGPYSFGCLKLLNEDPRFIGYTMGNHELNFIREVEEGKYCGSRARQVTHDKYNALSKKEKKIVMDCLKDRAYPYMILQNHTSGEKAFVSHAGVNDIDPMVLNHHHTTNHHINDVRDFSDERFVCQVHGHKSWDYTGDYTGRVVNIDTCCYESGILTAFNPYTREVITNERS